MGRALLPVLLCLAVFVAKAQHAGQKVAVSFAVTDSMRLDSALQKLTARYDVQFAYDADLLRDKYIRESFTNHQLSGVLEAWLQPHGLNAEYTANAVLIFPDPEIPEESVETKHSVNGRVVDASTGERLPYAHVKLLPQGRGAVTRQSGRFAFLSVKGEIRALAVSYIGYKSDTLFFDKEGRPSSILVELQPSSKNLDEVTVEEEKPAMLRTEKHAGVHTVDPFQLETVASTGQGNIMQAVQLLPGISAIGETSAGLHVRGGKADQNLILFDGFTIYHIDHVYGIFDAINGDAVKHIRLYKGGFPARYGDRASSVVDITGKEGNRKKVAARLGLDLMSARGRLEVPFSKQTSALATFRHSFTQFMQQGLYQDFFNAFYTSDSRNRRMAESITESVTLNPTVHFYDMNAKVSHDFEQGGRMALSVFSGNDRLEIDEEQTENRMEYDLHEQSSWGNYGTAIHWVHPWNESNESSVNMAFSRYHAGNAFRETYTSGQGHNVQELETRSSNEFQDVSVRGRHLVNWNQHQTRMGVEYTAYRAAFTHALNAFPEAHLDQKSQTMAAFTETRFNAGNNLQVNAGVRMLYQLPPGKWYAEPRLDAYLDITPALTLKAAYGWYHQFLSQFQTGRFQSGEPVYWLLADGDRFGGAMARHRIAGLQFRHRGWTVDAEFYHKKITGISGSQALSDPYAEADTLHTPFNIPQNGTNTAYGMDAMLQRSSGRWTGWLAYSFGISENRYDELNQGAPFPANYHRLHEINLVSQFRIKKFTLGAKWVYGTGTPYTKPDEDAPLKNPFDAGNLNAYRLPDYHRLDFTLLRTFRWNKTAARMGISLINVYNRTNLRSRVYRLEVDANGEPPHQGQDMERKVVPYDLELLHFTPNFFVRFEW